MNCEPELWFVAIGWGLMGAFFGGLYVWAIMDLKISKKD